ncbi:benzoate 4-monooxygenase cytochrome P450 [Cenococcum geophilum 1.58]|uniref:benzoate 4-monooxygenase cytochrome P450 n=1 Tax=Cenococcum geophilum 1.58 TaxID=794803 RepID=UPI00358FA262|nr:benzoate 4-monooxygenase cytochrome P450 [Cenococcum geophilum 1.58]
MEICQVWFNEDERAVGIVIYRRCFHPLAKIPGPFLPSVTTFYQTYYSGQYYKEIGRLHEQYGPVVRITPYEIHLSDPENYDRIYHMGTKFWKSPTFYGSFCIPHSTFATPSNEVHKHKRAMLNPIFSRKMVLKLERVVQSKANKLIKLMETGIRNRKPVDLHHAFRSVSVDVITDYAFDKSFDLLDSPDLGSKFFTMVRGVGPAMWILQQFEILQDLALKIPLWLAPILSEPLGHVVGLQMEGVKQIQDVRARMEAGKLGSSRPTIFSELLDPEKNYGKPIPSTMELKDEVHSLLAAAADTTGNAMITAAYHVISDWNTYQKVKAELIEAFPSSSSALDFVTLEKLAYLTGIVKEALRLSFGVVGRLPRVTPEPGASFNGYYIPPGTIVGMSSWMMHRNEKIFPDAMKFKPERWLDPADSRRLEKHMVPFGRGTRQSYCELYVTLGTLFRRFDSLRVFQAKPEDLFAFGTFTLAEASRTELLALLKRN